MMLMMLMMLKHEIEGMQRLEHSHRLPRHPPLHCYKCMNGKTVKSFLMIKQKPGSTSVLNADFWKELLPIFTSVPVKNHLVHRI